LIPGALTLDGVDCLPEAPGQRSAQLLLAKADVGAVSRQLELALLYDGKLGVRAMA
jgi:hypothetical protein